jgi:hypothetical protein
MSLECKDSCRFDSEEKSELGLASGVLDGSFVDEHDGDVVFDRIDALTLSALEGLRILAVDEGLLAGGADENFEQLRGDHQGIVRRHGEGISQKWGKA